MPLLMRSIARRKRSAPRGLHFEALEQREVLYAPVGNVTAQLVGSTLLLTGDALGNQLMVASVTGGKVAVLGANVSTTINGSTNPARATAMDCSSVGFRTPAAWAGGCRSWAVPSPTRS